VDQKGKRAQRPSFCGEKEGFFIRLTRDATSEDIEKSQKGKKGILSFSLADMQFNYAKGGEKREVSKE